MTRAWVEVDLGALRRNGAAMAARGAALVPMVKANAYGLGAVPVARALLALEPWGFGVATVAEGAELRAAGIDRRIIVFTPLEPDELRAAREAHLTPAMSEPAEIDCWRAQGGGAWHLAIDTGLNRTGVRWDAIDSLHDAMASHPPEGAFTHFHSAELDDGSQRDEEDRFASAIARLPAGVRPALLHAENSAALARTARSSYALARPGIFLYGAGSGVRAVVHPEPVVHVRARVAAVRTVAAGESVGYDATWRASVPSRIATLTLGYADGYRRALSNRGTVLIRGQRAPVAGLVSMDMTMVDVSDIACEVGDVATVIGRDGRELLDLERVAGAAGLSPYELLTGLGSRLERVYESGGPNAGQRGRER